MHDSANELYIVFWCDYYLQGGQFFFFFFAVARTHSRRVIPAVSLRPYVNFEILIRSGRVGYAAPIKFRLKCFI